MFGKSHDGSEEDVQHWKDEALALREQVSALQAEVAVLGSLSRNVPGVIYVLEPDAQGRPCITYVNDGLRELLGLEPQALRDDFEQIYRDMHPDDVAYMRKVCSTGLTAMEPARYEFRVNVPGKGWRTMGGRALRGTVSGRSARFGYLHDITEHKLYQEATIKARAAEQASAAKSEFLSRMSHELRTPLNAVLGFAQLLKLSESDPLTSGQRGKIDLMERAGQHLLAVINDVLDLSRIEAGQLPLSIENVSIADAFENALSLTSGLAQTSDVTLQAWQDLRQVGVRADRLRLQQVLVNLLSNGIKYNHAGGLVTLSAWVEGDRVALQVADNGPGMTSEQLSHLFEPFNRLGAENTPVEGSGIGLVIVRRLLQLMGGDLEVHSQAGQGSNMICWLPCADLEALPVSPRGWPAAPSPDVEAAAHADDLPWFKVLYAEDNEVNINLISEIFALRPHCVLTIARSGQEAIAAVRRTRPDLLLLDMQLGDMNGFDVVDQLERDPTTAGLPRVALSADAMPDTMRKAQAQGFRWYLTKPVDVMALISVVDALTDEARPSEG
ncbi:MAG TPA: ATP-binding protein [Aquabacterium sp.]|uniref:hybrid sensor histidine kinase/response regulator n=1 Tax=Aquabacterium sp. TaxID=1872578 RepID=UPI002E30D2DF|nr:ATP-binding protein [Aquabacterium sp.]HEX5372478.1 ATP-binding protein [Aquabacterium sp.]